MKQIRPLLWAAIILPAIFCGQILSAQQIEWLPLPINTSVGDPLLGPNPFDTNPAGTWIVTNLACYGNVLVTQTYPGQPEDYNNPDFENVPNASVSFIDGGTNGTFSWGPLGNINTVNTVSSTPVVWTINFYFLNGQPNFAGVVLMGAGLAEDTTATVSQPVIFRGEYDIIGVSAHTCLTNHSYNPLITTGSTNVGTIGNVMGSYFNKDLYGDDFNTGLALFQPTGVLQTTTLPTGSVGFPASSSPVPYLSLSISQQPGDGIGFNIGYICSTNGCTNSCITIVNPLDIITSTCSNCAIATYQAQVTDACCSNLTVAYNPPSGSCFPVGTNTVQVIATDPCGNSNSCSFTVTVFQNTNAPIILSYPAGITNCFPSGCGPMPNVTDQVQASGGVPGSSVNITQSIPPGTLICSNTTVTFTVTEACGQSTNVTVPVILSDNCCLHIGCPDGIIEETCSNSLPIFFRVPFQDNCCTNCTPTLVSTPPSGYNFPLGTTIVTNIVTDAAGNSNFCTFPVTVIQGGNCTNCLQIECPTNIVALTCSNSASVSYTVNYQDNCCTNCPVTLNSTPPSGFNFPLGTTVVTSTVMDAAGNSNFCTFDVTVIEDTNCTGCLKIQCPTNITVSSCSNSIPVDYAVNYQDDCCSNCPVELNSTPPSGFNFPLGTTLVTSTVTDTSGNSNFCTFTVTVVAGTNCTNCLPPVFGCVSSSGNLVPNGDFESYSNCPTGISQIDVAVPWFQPTLGTPEYFNACAPSSSGVSTPVNEFGTMIPHSGKGYAGIAVFGADDAPNSNSSREYLEVSLNSPLQANVTYGVSFYVSVAGISQYAIDSIGAYFSSAPEKAPIIGVLNVVPQVQNPSGNFLSSFGSWMLVSGTYTAVGGENYITIGNFLDDAVTLAVPLGFGAQPVSYYYIDDVSVTNLCGCPPDKTVDSNQPWTFDMPTAYDPVTGVAVNVTILSTVTNGSCPEKITQTWVASNSCGTNTCSQTVTVLEAPQILTTNITVTSCVSTQLFYTPTVVDPCCSNDEVVCSPPSGSVFPVGTTTVVCGVSNCLGVIATSTFTVTVIDSSVSLSQTNIEVTSCTNLPVYYNPIVTDCCSPSTLTLSPPSGSIFDVGTTTTVTYTLSDRCGSTNTGTFTVTVLPGTNCAPCLLPVFGCLTPSPNLVPNGDFETYTNCPYQSAQLAFASPWFQPTLGTPDYFNSCASVFTGVSTPLNSDGNVAPHSGNGYAGGTEYTPYGTDPANSYREYLEVQLNSALLHGQAYVVSFYVCLGSHSASAIDDIGAYFSVTPEVDNSTYDTLSVVPQVRNTPGVFLTSSTGWTLVSQTFTANGGEDYLTIGNFDDDPQTVSVPGPGHLSGAYYFFDDVSVTALCGCPPDKVVIDNSAWTFDAPPAYDPNTGATLGVGILSTVTNGPCPLTITRTWIATNSCGTNTCSQTVTVLETPQILCTNILVPSCVSTQAQVFYNPTAVDSCCSNLVVGCNPPSGSIFSFGTTTVFCMTTNCFGIVGTNSFTVTVTNMFLEQTNIVLTSCTNLPVFYNPTVIDGCCSNPQVTCYPPSGSTFDVGTTTTVDCVVTDPCHNTNVLSFTVTVLQGTNCTDCLQLQCSTNISVMTCSNCAKVKFAATATDPCCPGPITLTYSPLQPGSCFPVGTTMEEVTATDDCNKSITCSFLVTVALNDCPPIISVGPTNFVLCAGSSGCVPMPDEVHPTPNFYILNNTGVSGGMSASATATLPAGTLIDPHWTLVSVPTLPPASPLEFGTNTELQINPLPQWLSPDTLATWIAPANDASNDAPEGDYDYQTTFVLPTNGTFTITGQIAADDYLSDVLVNGGATGISTTNGNSATQWNPLTITGEGFAGTNTLDFIVHNNPTIGTNPPADNADSPSGLMVEFSGITIATESTEPFLQYNPAAVQATNCDGSSAPGWQSIPPGTILCGDTNITFVFTNQCGETTSYTAPIIVENCCVKPPPNMVLWFTFDETIGYTCLNSAGYNNGLRYHGLALGNNLIGPSHNLGEYVNNSLCFDGTGDKVLVPDYAALDFTKNFSIDAWVKWNGPGVPMQTLVDHRFIAGPNIFGYYWYLSNGRPSLQLATGTPTPVNFVSPTAIPVGVWTHLAVTVQRGSTTGVRFYVNGTTSPPYIFSDTGVVGAIGRPTFYLTVGDLNPVFRASAPFNGCMDELELFNRALAGYEVYDIYGAFHAGKCRPTCSVPPVSTLCFDANTVTVPVEVCNNGSTTQTLYISFNGLSSAQAGGYPPAVNGPPPVNFTGYPAYVTLPPGVCSNFFVTIKKPVGLTLTTVAYYEMFIHDSSGQQFSSIGRLQEIFSIWCEVIHNPPLTNVVIGTAPANFGFIVDNPAQVPITLDSQVVVVDGNLNPETNVISLNAQLPGTPVTNQISLPANGSVPVVVNVNYLDPQPITPYYLVLYLNISPDNTSIPVASAGFVQSVPPTVGPPVILNATNGQAVVTWDGLNTGWTLLSTTNVTTPSTNWIPVTLPVLPQPDGSQGIILPTTNSAEFFQLVKPVSP